MAWCPAAEIARLRSLAVEEADRALCAMHSDTMHQIAAALGVKLPQAGGDKAAILTGALFRLPHIRVRV